jgi:DUF4097 and DUF4098 domain-containing protein YvlB
MRSLFPLAFAIIALPAIASAQERDRQDREDFRWQRSLSSGQTVRLHNVNGNVTVTASNSGRVEIVGIKRGNSRYFEDITAAVEETSDGIVVCVVWRDSDDECNRDGFHSHGNDDNGNRWNRAHMDLEVRLPTNLEVSANSVSGNVSISGAQGDVRAASVSGDVRLERLRATSVRATTVSGEVTASIESLSGNGQLTFTSVSGNVELELPRNFDADLSMNSVSGQLDSDFQMTLGGRMRRGQRIEARIGRGGRDLDIRTVSGDVRLRMAR